MKIPRSEYPRPQMVRKKWMNLNGKWEFEIAQNNINSETDIIKSTSLKDTIIVPFCPESKLSGINNKNFMECVWYRKEFILPDNWKNNVTLLHIGASDYKTTILVNNKQVGIHKGGYSSFSFNITEALQEKDNSITIKVEDYLQDGTQPSGKQSTKLKSYSCYYTRTTGIWQSVWLENVSKTYVENFKLYPDPDNKKLHIEGNIIGDTNNFTLTLAAFLNEKSVGISEININSSTFKVSINISDIKLWEIDNPILYDLTLSLSKNNVTYDKINSYFGLRTVSFTNNEILINNKPLFQRLVLDQGFYPDGIYTAPSDTALKEDIPCIPDLM